MAQFQLSGAKSTRKPVVPADGWNTLSGATQGKPLNDLGKPAPQADDLLAKPTNTPEAKALVTQPQLPVPPIAEVPSTITAPPQVNPIIQDQLSGMKGYESRLGANASEQGGILKQLADPNAAPKSSGLRKTAGVLAGVGVGLLAGGQAAGGVYDTIANKPRREWEDTQNAKLAGLGIEAEALKGQVGANKHVLDFTTTGRNQDLEQFQTEVSQRGQKSNERMQDVQNANSVRDANSSILSAAPKREPYTLGDKQQRFDENNVKVAENVGDPTADTPANMQKAVAVFRDGSHGPISYNPDTGQLLSRQGTQLIDVSEKVDHFYENADAIGEPMYLTMVGGKPTWMPRSEAKYQPGAVTLYDAAGNASTGGVQGVSRTPPPAVPEGTQLSLSGWKLAIDQLDKNVIPQLRQAQSSIGPLIGRIKLAEIEKLGGMGASPKEIELAINLRRLLMSQAFAEGGKQLTPTEKEEFIALNPAMTDTFEQAIIKAQNARNYINDRYNMRLETMPVRQRNQIPGAEQSPQGNLAAPTLKLPDDIRRKMLGQ